MYSVTVAIRKLTCRDTESIHSSDKFALSGAIISDSDEAVGIYLPTIRINNGETRNIDRAYSIYTHVPIIGLSLTAWDIDEGDSWKESEDDIKTAVAAVATAVKLVPGFGTVVSGVISGVSAAVIGAINLFNGWDKDDKLLDYHAPLDLPNAGPNVVGAMPHTIRFSRSDPTGYSDWDYELELEIQYSWILTFPETPQITAGAKAAQTFRNRATLATAAGFLGAFPNFYVAPHDVTFVAGTIFVTRAAAEWRDVPLTELENVPLDNFEERMRVTNAYATRNGFVGGFPNYFHSTNGSDVVCGTILLGSNGAVWEDVNLEDLGSPPLDDFEARFRATQDYAIRKGFEGGFPNLFHAEKTRIDFTTGRRTRYTVCGTILLRSTFIDFATGRRNRVAERRDV